MDLTGKVAVVTGSGRGLGLAYAQALAAPGAAVVVNDVDQAPPTQAVAAIAADGGRAVAEVGAGRHHRDRRARSSPRRSRSSAGSTSWSPTPASCATGCCGR